MFSSAAKRTNSIDMPTQHGATTVIARGVRVEGDFTAQGDVSIDGDVNGHVTAEGTLNVGAEAKLKAEVTAEDAIIAGTIEGTIVVKKRLEVKSTARIIGNVTCETALVEAGAVLEGTVSFGGPTVASKKG